MTEKYVRSCTDCENESCMNILPVLKDLPEDLKDFDLIIYGHSHKYELIEKKHQTFLNPGSCGPRRFSQPITMAVGYVKKGKLRIEKIEIPHEEQK